MSQGAQAAKRRWRFGQPQLLSVAFANYGQSGQPTRFCKWVALRALRNSFALLDKNGKMEKSSGQINSAVHPSQILCSHGKERNAQLSIGTSGGGDTLSDRHSHCLQCRVLHTVYVGRQLTDSRLRSSSNKFQVETGWNQNLKQIAEINQIFKFPNF